MAVFAWMCAASCAQAIRKAADGRSAFVRWMADTTALVEGNAIYQVGEEGFPNPPAVALLLLPFHRMGPIWGALAWWAVKCIAMGLILRAVLVASDSGRGPLPGWAFLLVVALSSQPLIGDLTHGNMNLIVGALVAVSLLCARRSRDFLSGFLVGLAAAMKVTPGLFAPYFAFKRRWAALAGMAVAGLYLFVLLPGAALGMGRATDMTAAWMKQMVDPFVSGAPVDFMQTRQDNQSLTGLAYRLLTDSTAIRMKVGGVVRDVRVNVVALPGRWVDRLLKVAFVVLLVAAASGLKAPDRSRRHLGHLGEYAIVALCMLLISERSWKHHFVLLALAYGFLIRFLLRQAARRAPGSMAPCGPASGTDDGSDCGPFRMVLLAATAAAVLQNLFLDGIGRVVSDYAEAYGAHVAATVCLLAASVLAMRRLEVDTEELAKG